MVGQFYYTALGTGKRTNSAVGLINRASSGARNNARILGSGRVVATRLIPKNEEIFWRTAGAIEFKYSRHTQNWGRAQCYI